MKVHKQELVRTYILHFGQYDLLLELWNQVAKCIVPKSIGWCTRLH